MITNEWMNCYPSNWKGLIVDDAIVHPAKFSSKLIRRIYEHMIEMDWIHEGETVIDPFGGVALGALDALRLGLSWRGCELEQRFVDLGNANIAHWNKRFSSLPKWSGDAVLLQGDSRNLAVILETAQASVSSPPYISDALGHRGDANEIDKSKKLYARMNNAEYGQTDGNLGNMRGTVDGFQAAISSPPYADGAQHTGGDDLHLEHIKGGKIHLPGIAGAVSSPPYAESMNSPEKCGIDWEKAGRPDRTKPSEKRISPQVDGGMAYGSTPGQLGAMPARAESYRASVSSPPFENGSEGVLRADKFKDPEAFARVQMTRGHGASFEAKMRAMEKDKERAHYGDTDGNIGNDSGVDFWLAARAIVEQTYQVLSPGAHAVWVVKGFVKAKQYVDFPEQWRQLCEAVGFVTLHEHRAMLVHGKQYMLEGGIKNHESKSFFRRLAEKNGSPRVDWETIFCMEKPS